MGNFNPDSNEKRFTSYPGEYQFKIDGSSENVAERLQKRSEDDRAKAMEKYMPIGSVVRIKDSFKNYMIIGFNHEEEKECYDYLACQHPFGVDKSHGFHYFNHDQIDKVFHIGFVNEMERSYKERLRVEEVER